MKKYESSAKISEGREGVSRGNSTLGLGMMEWINSRFNISRHRIKMYADKLSPCGTPLEIKKNQTVPEGKQHKLFYSTAMSWQHL